jgi:zinc transport system substrate-binding protein
MTCLLKSLICLGTLILATVTGCREAPPERQNPLIVTSFFPLYDLVRQIVPEDCDVECLVYPGGDPHGQEPTPEMARLVERADVVVILGLGMDAWVEKLMQGNASARLLIANFGLADRRVGTAALSEFSDHLPNPDEIDPHLWLDPVLAGRLVENLALTLAERLPAHRAAIQVRSGKLLADLSALDAEFRSGLGDLSRRKVVTFHGAYGYLFARYHLETAGVVEPFPGDEPSAAYLRMLVDLMRRLGLRVIFAEPQLPDRAAQLIASEIGGRVERLDPCETILPEEPTATYQQRQRRNLETLVRVLRTP